MTLTDEQVEELSAAFSAVSEGFSNVFEAVKAFAIIIMNLFETGCLIFDLITLYESFHKQK